MFSSACRFADETYLPFVKVANTFIHVRCQDPDAFVARRSASSPPKIFKVISSSEQQQSDAVRPEANQGVVASAEHVGLESPGRSPIKAATADHVASNVSKPTAAASATTASS
ncbi:unnamed protein product, partial [Polarella glacialis]